MVERKMMMQQELATRQADPVLAEEGRTITVELPGEVTRAEVIRVVSRTRALVKIINHTTNSKAHNYKKDDFLAVEHRKGPMNVAGWYEIPQSQLDAATEPEPMEEVDAEPREMTEGDL